MRWVQVGLFSFRQATALVWITSSTLAEEETHTGIDTMGTLIDMGTDTTRSQAIPGLLDLAVLDIIRTDIMDRIRMDIMAQLAATTEAIDGMAAAIFPTAITA